MDSSTAASSTRLLDLLFDEPGAGRCLVAPDGSVLRVNSEWLRSTGFALDDVLGADIVGLFPGTRDMSLALHARARSGQHVEVPLHAQRVGGRDTWWEGCIDPVPMEGGNGLLITAREAGAPKRRPVCTEPACGSLFDVVSDAVFVHDASTGAVLDVNRAAEEMYEASRELLCAGGIEAFSEGSPPYGGREAAAYLRAAAAGTPQRFEWRAKARSGRLFWVEVTLKSVGPPRCERLFAVVRDITDRKRADEALRDSEEQARQRLAELEALYATAPVGLCVFDRELRWVRLNERIAEMNGVPAADHLGKTPREVVPDVGEQAEAALRRILETGEPILDFEMTGTTAAQPGVVRSWSERWIPIKDARGRITGISVAAEEITDRKRAQEALRESESKLRLLANAMPQIVCVLAPDGTAEYVNPRWTEFSGLGFDETRAAGWVSVLHPEDVPGAMECRRRALRLRTPQEVELRYRAADGSYRWFLSRLAPVVERDRVVRFVGAAMQIEDRKRTEEALEAQLALKDQLAKVAAAVPGVVCSFRLRPDGAVSMPFSAPAIEDLYGFSPEELARDMRPAIARTDPEDLERTAGEIQASARLMAPWRSTFRYHHPTKGLRWIEGASIPSREEDGSTLWHGYVADVTDQRRAEEALRRSEQALRDLAEAMPQLIWTSRPDGSPEYFNRNWCEYTGITLRDSPGDEWSRAMHPDDLARTLARWRQSLATGEPYDVEHRLRARDGAFRWFLARAVPVRDSAGRIVRWFGTATDIQDQKHVEDELVAAKRALGDYAERLQEEHRRKDEFLGMLSHELRNPLAPIRNSVYLLRHAPVADAERSLRVIERQTEHLTRLVDDLLDVTRIARGKIQLRREPLDLRDVVRRAGEDFRSVMDERGVAFDVVLPPDRAPAEADPTRLGQVIGNLLSNAAKFTRRGDRVILSLFVNDEGAFIRVRDTGAGIEPGLLPSIFDPFVQADRTLARSDGGLGLGLALVKGLVHLHGGDVSAESGGTGRGATFSVRLPTAVAAEAASPDRRRDAPRCEGRAVLVVDDNRDAADSLAALVRVMGHQAEVVYDGESALASVQAHPPDVILCDIGLPGIDGYEVARRIRALPIGRVRLVAVSGYAQPEDVARTVEAGFDGHVAKPPDLARLERLLG